MGFIRNINNIHKIDRVVSGDILYADRTSPGNNTARTGWNELAETVNALQEWGRPVSLPNRINGKYHYPFCGNFGPSHTQEATRENGKLIELVPGATWFTLLIEVLLPNRWNAGAAAMGNQYISIDLINGAAVHNIVNLCGFSAPADLAQFPGVNFTIDTNTAAGVTTFVMTGQVNTPGIIPAADVTEQGYLRVRQIQSNPKNISGLWDNYADGLRSGTFYLHAARR